MHAKEDRLISLVSRIEGIVSGGGSKDDRLLSVCRLLDSEMDHYH